MTDSTYEAVKAAAQQALDQGNPDFHVLAATRYDTHMQYVVTLPKAGWRTGVLPRRGGCYTKFGRDLSLRLNATHHVEASVGLYTPHTMTVFIDMLMPDEPRIANHQMMGLPPSVALIIQTVIMRNHGIFQRCFEYLRRLF